MQSALPPPATPLVTPNLLINPEWYKALNLFHLRTGGTADDLIARSLRATGTGIVVVTDPDVGGTVTRSLAAGTGLNISNGSGVAGNPTYALANTAVTPASYGNSTNVPAYTVDAQGRLTAAANLAIAFPVTSVAGKTGAVTIQAADITDASVNGRSMLTAADYAAMRVLLGVQACAFSARLTADVTNFAGDSAHYTVICDGELYDIGSGYDNTTGIFTVPTGMDGLYHFDAISSLNNIGAAHVEAFALASINGTTAGHYGARVNPFVTKSGGTSGVDLHLSFDVNLAATDTVRSRPYVGGGGATKVVTLQGIGTGVNVFTSFSGHRIGPAV